ncbi:MAG: hypothetical protein EA412_09335 [Chitinophagaceae bacterium]|nr:MAG: hypothetical protein EA412_09335 [Chitinophagaceae bacterium]
MLLAGIDYGSKLAGTTVISLLKDNKVTVLQSEKKKDADLFILDNLPQSLQLIALDAPMSLPGVYRGLKNKSNYFYRESDAILKAMSPMFLGGLTARAMALKEKILSKNIQIIESYPAGLFNLLSQNKPKNIESILDILPGEWQLPEIKNLHQADSLLCLYSAVRFTNGTSQKFGDEEEGVIIL